MIKVGVDIGNSKISCVVSDLKSRWVVENTKIKGEEPSKVETLQFIDKWIKILDEMRTEILKSRS